MDEEPTSQLRRRRSSGNPNLPLCLETGIHVNEGGPSQGTPTPSTFKSIREGGNPALEEFRKKQQSFDVQEIKIEECEEEEILLDSGDEADDDKLGVATINRPITPTPRQDFAANTVYTEGPQVTNFLQVKPIEQEGYTDVSDADTEEEEE